LVVVDELATVTNIGKAPGWWGRLIREGRHRRIEIAAAAQRPAEIDKTIIGNCTHLVVFRLGRLRDRQLMAEELDLERADIDQLEPLEFIRADRLQRKIEYSRIVFAR
jgi:DNA helicase HerA-like ATPase